jgi:hypothetical protein
MAKGRRSIIHYQLAIDVGMGRAGRPAGLRGDEETTEAEQKRRFPDFNPGTDGEADARPVMLDQDAQAKLLAYLRGKLESDHLVEVAQFLRELADDADAAEDGVGLEPGPGGVAGAGMPWIPENDRNSRALDARFPDLKRITNLGAAGVAPPRPKVSGGASDGRAERRFPDLKRIRTV